MINNLRVVYYTSIVFFIIILLALCGCSPYRKHDLQVINSNMQVKNENIKAIQEYCKIYNCDVIVTGK